MASQSGSSGTVVAVLISSDPHSIVSTKLPLVNVLLTGFEGDKHSGFTRPADTRTPYYPRGTEIRNNRQVTLVSSEELEQVARVMAVPEVLPEWLGANLLLAGIPGLSRLPANTRLVFEHQAVLVVQNENGPCKWPGLELAKAYGRSELEVAFINAALHLRGLAACVERPGVIHTGEIVAVELPK